MNKIVFNNYLSAPNKESLSFVTHFESGFEGNIEQNFILSIRN